MNKEKLQRILQSSYAQNLDEFIEELKYFDFTETKEYGHVAYQHLTYKPGNKEPKKTNRTKTQLNGGQINDNFNGKPTIESVNEQESSALLVQHQSDNTFYERKGNIGYSTLTNDQNSVVSNFLVALAALLTSQNNGCKYV